MGLKSVRSQDDKLRQIKKLRGAFHILINDRACDHGYACWHETLHCDGNANSFRTVHSIHHSYLPASFGIAHFIAIFKVIRCHPGIETGSTK